MQRIKPTFGVFAVVVGVLALSASPVLAQMPSVLYGNTNAPSFVFEPIGSALSDLGLRPTEAFTAEDFLTELRLNRYDLVIFRGKERFREPFEFEIIAELEAHVARGGRLHFQIAELDSAPQELLDVLGVAEAIELLADIDDIWAPLATHPSVPGFGFLGLRNELFPPDFGDVLVPGSSAFVTQTFGEGGPASTIIARGGRVLVNGQQWDNWDDTSSGFAEKQIMWLLDCPADLDGDGDLTLFDFLTFQNLFDGGDPTADVFYDGRLNLFDFLEFFGQFEAGCP